MSNDVYRRADLQIPESGDDHALSVAVQVPIMVVTPMTQEAESCLPRDAVVGRVGS